MQMVLKSLLKSYYLSKNSKYLCPNQIRYIRGNHLPFMNKNLSKAIIYSARFPNNYLKKKTDKNKRNYTKQITYCVSLLRKPKKKYCSSLDVKNINDNKTFWKTLKPFLLDKIIFTQKATVIDNDKIVKDDEDTVRVVNTFFSNIVTDYNDCGALA